MGYAVLKKAYDILNHIEEDEIEVPYMLQYFFLTMFEGLQGGCFCMFCAHVHACIHSPDVSAFFAVLFQPKLMELLGKDKFDEYAGKIWQLKFCEDYLFIS